jgi:hypothetical protein
MGGVCVPVGSVMGTAGAPTDPQTMSQLPFLNQEAPGDGRHCSRLDVWARHRASPTTRHPGSHPSISNRRMISVDGLYVPTGSILNLNEVFPHHGAVLGVKDCFTYPVVPTRVDIPLGQIHFRGPASSIQLLDLFPAHGTRSVFGMKWPRHRSVERGYFRWSSRPFLNSQCPYFRHFGLVSSLSPSNSSTSKSRWQWREASGGPFRPNVVRGFGVRRCPRPSAHRPRHPQVAPTGDARDPSGQRTPAFDELSGPRMALLPE